MIHYSKFAARPLRSRPAFTLVELLVVIVIIALLASMVLFAMFGSQESARKARTQSTITKLHSAIMTKWEEYRVRRVPLSGATALERLSALRELQRLEMPDRWFDITDAPVSKAMANPSQVMGRPSVSQAYLRILNLKNPGTPPATTDSNDNAKCLYLIVSIFCEDGLESFSNGETGEVDTTHMNVFLDGWQKPIGFIRWPAGFLSPNSVFQAHYLGDPKSTPIKLADLNVGDPIKDHDPFDVQRADPNAYALVPLIYSGGPDGQAYILSDFAAPSQVHYNTVTYTSGVLTGPINPYYQHSGGGIYYDKKRVGAPNDDPTLTPPGTYYDNIHNHMIGAR